MVGPPGLEPGTNGFTNSDRFRSARTISSPAVCPLGCGPDVPRELYQKQGIAPETLSREIEDTGIITSPLIPWNSCGAYMAATLGVATWACLPFVFFNLINVVVSFAYAIFGIQIRHVEPEKKITEAPDEVALYGIGKRRGKPTMPEDAKPKGELQPA